VAVTTHADGGGESWRAGARHLLQRCGHVHSATRFGCAYLFASRQLNQSYIRYDAAWKT
jgi:hypothetical protein